MEPLTSVDQGSPSKAHCGQKRTSTSMEQGSSSKAHCGQERTGVEKGNPKHKIFLSHSGKQKEFVRQLCKDLEAETHEPFFDEEPSSLPMGERFAPLIFEAARQCCVAVIVLSEDFLTSKWPMLELVEFVEAMKSNPHLKLFPLFYKLSPEDIKVDSIASRWEAAWAKIITPSLDQVMPQDDTRRGFNLSSCIEALAKLRGVNGPKFGDFGSEVDYREAIVEGISLLVAPNLLDDTSDVIGNERLCKILAGMFLEDTLEGSNLYGTHKLGLHGMGGLGKTTMCRALCMFFHQHFNGRVFHVELGSRPPLDLQKLVLTRLLRINQGLVEKLNTVHEGRKLLQDHMHRQPVFLAIDNITNDDESKSQALAFLEAGFHPGSMIMITSRSLDVVEDLFPKHLSTVYCKAMVKLSEEEARLIFLRRAAPQRKLDSLTLEEREILDVCLSQCHFSVDNVGSQYHPLGLQALADYYHEMDKMNMLTWKQHHQDLDKWRLSSASSNIFGVLGLQFMTLETREKLIFLDLCLYIYVNHRKRDFQKVLSWLSDIHEERRTTVNIQLRRLKRSGIINITLDEDGDQFITIHDLYKEFAQWYVIDGEGSRCLELGCVYHTIPTNSLPYVLKKKDPSSSLHFRRVRLENLTCVTFPSKKVQEWCNVVVLEIYKCSNLKVLDLHGLNCLRHLELVELCALESFDFVESQVDSNNGANDTLESLQHVVLNNLRSLKRLPNFSLCTALKTFEMVACEEFLSEPPSFVGCSQLEDLEIRFWDWSIEDLKLDTLTSLTSLYLNGGSAFFGHEDVSFLTITGLGTCSRLQNLSLLNFPISDLLGLEKLTELQCLFLFCCDSVESIPDVSTLAKLRVVHIDGGSFEQFPGIDRLLQLRYLQLSFCDYLTSLPDLSHLPELIEVMLEECPSLQVKPELPLGCRFYSGGSGFDPGPLRQPGSPTARFLIEPGQNYAFHFL